MSKTKDHILKKALILFAKEGYEAVSVSQIAGELGLTKGALYKHYKNKIDIFDSIVKKMEQDDAIRAQPYNMPIEANTKTITANQIVSFALSQFRYWTEDEFALNFRKMLIIEQFRSDEMQRLYQQYLSSGQLEYVKEVFETFGVGNASDMAMNFFSPMFLCYSLYDKGENTEKLYGFLETHFNVFIMENKL